MSEQNTLDMEPSKPKTAVAERKPRAVAVVQTAAPTTPMDLLRIVTERGASVEEIGKFMDLMERQQANEAKQAFMRAMAEFKKNPPSIEKNKVADFKTDKGRTVYAYSDLANVCDAITAGLAEHGISHEWSPVQSGSNITVTCTITHEMGHSKSATLSAEADRTGGKNAIQAIGSAVSYLERYTLLAVCGIAVKDGSDDDGAATGLDPNAVRDAVADKAPAKHKIGQSQLRTAIESIKKGDYNYADLVGYYDLAPEQLEFTKKELGIA